MGDKEQYPEMDMNSDVTHKWKVTLRHPESIGEIKGNRTYRTLIRLLNRAYAKQV